MPLINIKYKRHFFECYLSYIFNTPSNIAEPKIIEKLNCCNQCVYDCFVSMSKISIIIFCFIFYTDRITVLPLSNRYECNLSIIDAAKRVTFDAFGSTTTAHFPGSARWSGISSIVTPSNHAVPFAPDMRR